MLRTRDTKDLIEWVLMAVDPSLDEAVAEAYRCLPHQPFYGHFYFISHHSDRQRYEGKLPVRHCGRPVGATAVTVPLSHGGTNSHH